MEEAWELAALGADVMVSRSINWSGRHTRLRYQAVVFTLVLLAISYSGISEVKLPAFFVLAKTPNYTVVWLASAAFSLFSIISFYYQTQLEIRVNNAPIDAPFSSFKEQVSTGLSDWSSEELDGAYEELLGSVANLLDPPKTEFVPKTAITTEAQLNAIDQVERLGVGLEIWRRSHFISNIEIEGLYDELRHICGAKTLEFKQIKNVLAGIGNEFDDIAEHLLKIEKFLDDWDTSPSGINFEGDDLALKKEVSLLGGSLKIIDTGLTALHSFGEIIVSEIHDNIQLYNVSTLTLSWKIPFGAAIFLFGMSILVSFRNVYLYWTV